MSKDKIKYKQRATSQFIQQSNPINIATNGPNRHGKDELINAIIRQQNDLNDDKR